MRPILFQWRGLTIRSYPALLYLGLVAGVVTANVAAHAAGVDAFRVFVATCFLTIPALLGARLFHVATHWPFYRRSPGRIWNRREGGAAQYGAFIVVLPVSVPLLAGLQLPFGAFWDVATPAILVGMIFVRIGCLMNGCCAGRPSGIWMSVYLPNVEGVWARRLPSQYFELGWIIVLLICTILVGPRLPFRGALFLLVTAAYALGRLVLVTTRERHPGAGRLSIHQGISAALIVLSLTALTIRWPE